MLEEFAALPEMIPRARHTMVGCLRTWGLGELIPPIELAFGELFTNAVRHGRGPIRVVLALLPGRLRLEVHDQGGGRPAVRPVQTSGPRLGGWGLRLVENEVDLWGTDVRPGHTVVWVERALDPP
jgi:anti-sigma regulatory factor (Ser/Thr protein kinase)